MNSNNDVKLEETTTAVEFAQLLFPSKGLEVDHDFWRVLEDDDILLVLDLRYHYVLSGPSFLKATSYELHELRSAPWFELFSREDFYSKQIKAAFAQALATNKPQYKVTAHHLIKETKSVELKRFYCCIKAVFPVHIQDQPESPVALAIIKGCEPLPASLNGE